MNNNLIASALTTGLITAIASGGVFAAATYTLQIGTPGPAGVGTPGSVEIGLDGYGGFGSDVATDRDIGDATLNTLTRSETSTVSSFLAARFGANPQAGQLTGPAQYIGSGLGVETVFGDFFDAPGGALNEISTAPDRIETTFSSTLLADLDFRLVQTTGRFDTNPGGTTQGSFLQQDYEVTNNTGASISGELLRYATFELNFSSATDQTAGGKIERNGEDFLFSTQDLVGDATSTVYTVIGAEILGNGNPDPTVNRFEFGLRDITDEHVLDTDLNGFLSDAVLNDDGSGQTQFLGTYSLAFRNSFTVAVGESFIYRTTTFWGTGSIANFNPPSGGGGNPAPSPGSLALFGLAGWGLTRFRKKQQRS